MISGLACLIALKTRATGETVRHRVALSRFTPYVGTQPFLELVRGQIDRRREVVVFLVASDVV
jgi:hypothetical protein